MNLYTFFNTIIEAIAQDTELDSWAINNFGQGVHVYADIDTDAAPDTDDMPYVICHSPGRSAHQDQAAVLWTIEAWLAFTKSTYKTLPDENVTEPTGVELISTFIEYVEDAIADNLPANFSMGSEVGTDTAGMLPEVHARVIFEFTQRLTIGTDPLA